MNSQKEPSERRCKDCNAPLSRDSADELCLRCALGNALKPPDQSSAASSVSSEHAAAPGKTPESLLRPFGDYELLEEIARGGMGVVYRARQVSLDRIVAVKMILFGPLASAEQVRRFRTEASAAGCLQHPNIVAIHEVGLHEKQHYLAMDYVDGPNLGRLVHEGPLSAKRAAGYAKVIAEAVHYAHERGILHRDLKPSNVLIDSDDRPRVVDFGLAKRFTGDSSLTLSGQVLGSPSYMPPEQAGAGQVKVGRYSDVYSLGAILYHLLTGRPPFQAETVPQTLQRVENAEPVSPRLLNPSVSRDLETICLKCLEKEPGKRYPTAHALADELGRFLNGESIISRPIGRSEKLWRYCRRNPALTAAFAGLAVAIIGGFAGITWKWLEATENYSQLAIALAENDLITEAVSGASGSITINEGTKFYFQQRHEKGLFRRPEVITPQATGVVHQEGSPLKRSRDVTCSDLSPDKRWVAVAFADGTASVRDAQTGQSTMPPLRHNLPVNAVRFSPDSRVVATGSSDTMTRIWDWRTGRLLAGPLGSDGTAITGIRFTLDGKHLVSLTASNTLTVWNASTWQLRSSRVVKLAPLNIQIEH